MFSCFEQLSTANVFGASYNQEGECDALKNLSKEPKNTQDPGKDRSQLEDNGDSINDPRNQANH